MSRIVTGILIALGYVLLIPLAPFAVRIVQEYERGVVFRLGRLQGARGPGLFIIIPIIERFFALISDPNIAFLLLSLGGAAIFIEILNPGLLFPGIFGIIALVLAFFSFGTLPINWAGVALIGLAFALFAAEIFVSGFGILGIGGAVSLVLGGLLLTSTSNADFQVNRWLLYSVAIVISAFFIMIMGALLRSRGAPATMGIDAMVGRMAVARSSLDPGGVVFMDGARWQAHTSGPKIEEGEDVVVTEVEGLTLTVEKPDEEESEES